MAIQVASDLTKVAAIQEARHASLGPLNEVGAKVAPGIRDQEAGDCQTKDNVKPSTEYWSRGQPVKPSPNLREQHGWENVHDRLSQNRVTQTRGRDTDESGKQPHEQPDHQEEVTRPAPAQQAEPKPSPHEPASKPVKHRPAWQIVEPLWIAGGFEHSQRGQSTLEHREQVACSQFAKWYG